MGDDESFLNIDDSSEEEEEESLLDLETVSTDVGFIKDDVDIIKSNIRELQGDINILKDRRTHSTWDEVEWDEWADEVRDDLDTLKGKRKKLGKAVDANYGFIEDLESRVRDVEYVQNLTLAVTVFSGLYAGTMVLVGAILMAN